MKDGDIIVAPNQGMLNLLNCVDAYPKRFLTLKSINLDAAGVGRPISKFLDKKGVVPIVDAHQGRAGKRLANMIALIDCLRQNDGKDLTPN